MESLVARAVDTATVTRLHDIWPRVLDCLLPEFRNLEPLDGVREREPYHHVVEELDCALLLVPPDATWPLEETFRLGTRWLAGWLRTTGYPT